MTQSELLDFYQKRKIRFSDSLRILTKKINVISNLRLSAALVFLALLYFGLMHDRGLLYLLAPVLVTFIVLVRKHALLFEEKVHLENLVRVQQHELSGLEGDFSHNGSGSEFIDIHHPYTHDLDIFGEGSLFQYINRCHTRGGKRLLAERLASAPKSAEVIARRQQAVKEVAGKNEFRHEVQALGMQIDEQQDDQRQLDHWLAQPGFLYGKKAYGFILKTFPVVTLALVVSALLVDGIGGFAVLAAALQWVFLGFHLKRINAFHQYISRKQHMLEKYHRTLHFIQGEKYASAHLQQLGANAIEAGEKVRQLASLVRAFDARNNSMTNLVVNSLLLYDLQCVYRLEKWKVENASRLQGWIDTIYETEVLCSMATFSFNHPGFSFPMMSVGRRLVAKDLGHPLLSDSERVNNDLHLDEEQSVLIITGANMAGKSTFLRSVGVNVVLALSGAPVCASEFHCPLIGVRSGMRTADSLKEHQSYFYAELDRLKSIMDELRQGKPVLILLDEILKGTNSTDKQAGSVALVKQLVDHPCLALIATHDLALGDLERQYPGKVRNYAFEASIENDQLFFDYKLKRGLAQKMNATFLMRKMGIIGTNTTA